MGHSSSAIITFSYYCFKTSIFVSLPCLPTHMYTVNDKLDSECEGPKTRVRSELQLLTLPKHASPYFRTTPRCYSNLLY